MNRYFVLFLMAVAAGQAMAQSAEVSEERTPVFNSAPQRAAELHRQARPAALVQPTGGDELATAADDSIGNDRAGLRGEQLARTRDLRHPGHAPSTQGGTPDMVGAK